MECSGGEGETGALVAGAEGHEQSPKKDPHTMRRRTSSSYLNDQEIVAVGTVSHVVRRAFHRFYPQIPVSSALALSPDKSSHEPNAEQTGPEEASTSQVATASTVPASTSLQQPQQQMPSQPNEGLPRSSLGEGSFSGDANGGTENHCHEKGDNDNNSSNVLDESSRNPFVLLGVQKAQQIEDNLVLLRSSASKLLRMMDTKKQEAKLFDEQIEQQLRDQGLVVKAQIPMGPSNLRLSPEDWKPFGVFASNLVHARQLVARCTQKRLDRSGNGAVAIKRTRIEIEPPGYLTSTASVDIRKASTLALHPRNQQEESPEVLVNASEEEAPTTSSSVVSETPADSSSTVLRGLHGDSSNVMKPAERRRNMEILERMQRKLDYLRNPRYVAPSDRSHNPNQKEDEQDSSKKPIHCDFTVIPNPIIFTEYDIDGIYEKRVVVRNSSRLSRRVRVIPPSTARFSIDRIIFPDGTGVVAPGMSVNVLLRFMPDSRADHKDHITIHMESAKAGEREMQVVPILARRKPPELSLPLVIRADTALVGGKSLTRIQCRNTGGKGRFWVMSEREWEIQEAELSCAMVDSSQHLNKSPSSDHVTVGPFRLTPNDFEVEEGQQVELQLLFVPNVIGEQREKIVFVCDNCLFRSFQLQGKSCQVDLVVSAVNDKHVETGIVNMAPVDRLEFEPTLIQSVTKQRFQVTNNTPIALKYSWRVYAEEAMSADPDPNLQAEPNQATSQSPRVPFRIKPSHGQFGQNSHTAFRVDFSPTESAVSRCCAVLYIDDIPKCSMPGKSQMELLEKLFELLKVQSPFDSRTHQLLTLESVESMAILLHGVGQHGQMDVSPQFFRFESPLVRNSSAKTIVKLRNESEAQTFFEWDISAATLRSLGAAAAVVGPAAKRLFNLDVSPVQGTLEAHRSITCELEFTPLRTGSFSVVVPVFLLSANKTRLVSRRVFLEGVVASGSVRFDVAEVDFGLVSVGASAEASLRIVNDSITTTNWSVCHLEAREMARITALAALENSTHGLGGTCSFIDGVTTPLTGERGELRRTYSSSSRHSALSSSTSTSGDFSPRDVRPRAILSFSTDSGELLPHQEQIIRVKCSSGTLPERFRGTICCEVAAEESFSDVGFDEECTDNSRPRYSSIRSISCRAEIQSPSAFMSPSTLQLHTTYLGVTVQRTIELVNLSNLEAPFKWREPQGASKAFTVEFVPKSGVLRSKERVSVVMNYTPRIAGKTTALFACFIRGISVPLGLEVITTQRGLVLTYDLVENAEQAAKQKDLMATMTDGEKENAASSAAMNYPRLHFGDEIPLNKRKSLYLLVRNLSGIEATIEFEAKKYRPGSSASGTSSTLPSSSYNTAAISSDSPVNNSATTGIVTSRARRRSKGQVISLADSSSPPTRPSFVSTSRSKRAGARRSMMTKSTVSHSHVRKAQLLGNSHETQLFQSKKGLEFLQERKNQREDRQQLKAGKGIAFRIEPSHVRISAWDQALVTITSFNNMTGSFTDEIIARTVGMPPVILNASAKVVGVPLELDRNCVGLYMTGKNASKPTLRWSQICLGASPVTKTIRIINKAPRAALVKWKVQELCTNNQLVRVTLGVDAHGKLKLRIVPVEEKVKSFPFEVSPSDAVVDKHATQSFQVTFTPSSTPKSERLLLVADAKWEENENLTSVNESLSTVDTETSRPPVTEHDVRHEGEHSHPQLQAPTQALEQRTSPTNTLSARLHTQLMHNAAGKALQAVRLVNKLMHVNSQRSDISPFGALVPKCISLELASDVIEPSLYLDKKRSVLESGELGGSTTADPVEAPSYRLKFTTWSTLLTQSEHKFHRKQLHLTNQFTSKLTFRFETEGPFVVVKADSLAPRHPLSGVDLPPQYRRFEGESFMFSLPPGHAVHLELRFSPKLLNETVHSAPLSSAPTGSGLGKASSRPSLQSQSTDKKKQAGKELVTTVQGKMLVKFTSGSVQTFELLTEILRPLVAVTPSQYYFGHVHLTKTRFVVLRVANPTSVDADFTIVHVPVPTPVSRAQRKEALLHAHLHDDPSVFGFSMRTGTVKGPTLSLASAGGKMPSRRVDATKRMPHQLIKPCLELVLTFAPKQSLRYRSRFRFTVQNGNDFDILVDGDGTLDEHERQDQAATVLPTRKLLHKNRIF